MTSAEARFRHDELMFRLLIKRDNKTINNDEEEIILDQMEDLWYDLSEDEMDDVNALVKQTVNNYEFTGKWLKELDGTKSI